MSGRRCTSAAPPLSPSYLDQLTGPIPIDGQPMSVASIAVVAPASAGPGPNRKGGCDLAIPEKIALPVVSTSEGDGDHWPSGRQDWTAVTPMRTIAGRVGSVHSRIHRISAGYLRFVAVSGSAPCTHCPRPGVVQAVTARTGPSTHEVNRRLMVLRLSRWHSQIRASTARVARFDRHRGPSSKAMA